MLGKKRKTKKHNKRLSGNAKASCQESSHKKEKIHKSRHPSRKLLIQIAAFGLIALLLVFGLAFFPGFFSSPFFFSDIQKNTASTGRTTISETLKNSSKAYCKDANCSIIAGQQLTKNTTILAKDNSYAVYIEPAEDGIIRGFATIMAKKAPSAAWKKSANGIESRPAKAKRITLVIKKLNLRDQISKSKGSAINSKAAESRSQQSANSKPGLKTSQKASFYEDEDFLLDTAMFENGDYEITLYLPDGNSVSAKATIDN